MELTLTSYTPVIETFELDEIINMEGICTQAFYVSSDNSYGIFLFEDNNECIFSVLSNTTALVIGQSYFLRGKVAEYQGKKQLRLYDFIPYKPNTKHAIVSFLKAIPGLKAKAELIYDSFGEDAIEIVISHPNKLKQLRGIGKGTVEKVKNADIGFDVDYKTIITLYGWNFSTNQVIKTIQAYKGRTIFTLTKNPYILMDLPSFSFTFCDKLANTLGFLPDSPQRMNAAGISVLENAAMEGNVYLPNNECLPRIQELLTVKLPFELLSTHLNERSITYFGKTYPLNQKEIKDCIGKKTDYVLETFSEKGILKALKHSVIQIDDRVYLRRLYDAEVSFATALKENIENRKALYTRKEIENVIDHICKQENIELEQQQREAVITCCKFDSGTIVLNGSAGTGKTFVTKFIVKTKSILTAQNHPNEETTFLGLAPTGKAAKVMNNSLKSLHIPCETIHHALGYDGCTFQNDQFSQNFFIVDESSMVDIILASAFINAVPPKSTIIFLGDTKQLASVGPGTVLKDLIESHALPIITLNVVKRQTALSGILKNAEHVIAKEMVESTPATDDFYLMKCESNEQIQNTMIRAMDRLFDRGFTLEDVQLLIPQRTGEIGIYYFNYILQRKLNPYRKGLSVPKTTFTIGKKTYHLNICKNDKVMHIKNDYSKELIEKVNGMLAKKPSKVGITNGEIGIVSDIYVNQQGATIVQVKYEDYYTEYSDVSNLEIAYAVTIHKSQGSQWPATLIVMGNSHFHMLSNNILYTAITRSIDFCGVIYNEKAIKHAIKTEKDSKRYTSLSERLMEN